MPAREASRTLLSRLEPQGARPKSPQPVQGLPLPRRVGADLRHVIEGKRGLAGGPAKREGGAPPESLRVVSRPRWWVAASP
jgi:hypothetical protein